MGTSYKQLIQELGKPDIVSKDANVLKYSSLFSVEADNEVHFTIQKGKVILITYLPYSG